jgi:selenium metabolism protein YedF
MKKVIVIQGDSMGKGDDDLGKKLLCNFLRKLTLQEILPKAIIFYNSGVKLLAEGTPVLVELEALEKKGVDLIACGTCVNYFELEEKILVGRVSDMQEIVSHVIKDERVVTI